MKMILVFSLLIVCGIFAAKGIHQFMGGAALQESQARLDGQRTSMESKGFDTSVADQPVRWLETSDMNRINGH